MTLGQRIQELRKKAGLSQEGLGEALGVSRQAVSKWEGDNGIPELDTLITMSRLFGITMGELLGVEEPKEAEEPSAEPLGEEQIEAILRRYVEQTRPREPEKKALGWKLPLAAGCLLLVLIMVLFAQIGEMKNTIGNLRGQLSSVQSNLSNVSGQVSNITEEIRQTLAEESKLLSTCSYDLVDADLEAQTVTLRFEATLKEYTAGSKLQFLLDWIKVDDTEGQSVSQWVEGPDFSVEVTLPMNYHAELSIRVENVDGNIKEEFVDDIYGLHPDSFSLDAYNLLQLVDLTISYRGITSTYSHGAYADAEIVSAYPDYLWPEQAIAVVWVNKEQVMNEPLTILPSEDSRDVFRARLESELKSVTLREGDKLEIILTVIDNLGRIERFTEGGTVNDGELKQKPAAAPAVRVD